MTTNTKDRIKILELEIEEQRRDYDVLKEAYESAKVKNITFLAAGLALLTYLYASTSGSNLREKLFIPKEAYGVIIYGASAAMFLFALAMLLYALKTRRWSTAYDNNQEEMVSAHGYEYYLQYMKRRYLSVYSNNSATYKAKQTLLDMSFIPLVSGGIILVVLKTFGG